MATRIPHKGLEGSKQKVKQARRAEQLIKRSRELHKKLSNYKLRLTDAEVDEINRVDDELAKQFEVGTWVNRRPVKLGGKMTYAIDFDYDTGSNENFIEYARLTRAQATEIEARLTKLFDKGHINNLSVLPANEPSSYTEILERCEEVEAQFEDDDEPENT